LTYRVQTTKKLSWCKGRHATPTHSPVSTGWRSRSVFNSSWRQSSIVYWMVWLLTTWLQIYAVCLICRPDDVWDLHSLTSSMSASRSVLLLETELSLWLVLDYGTVCHMISSRVTHCHSHFRRGLKTFLF